MSTPQDPHSHVKPHLHIDTPTSRQQPPPSHHKPKAELPTDVIDLLDESVPPGLLRHHDSPYDPVTRSAYLPNTQSPLVALQHSTQEALKATPESAIRDSLVNHVPLQNTAVVAPGEHIPGPANETMSNYQEENLLGDVGRWQGIEYDDDDRRAKGHAGWDGAFANSGHNKAERVEKEVEHGHKPARGKQAWGEYVDDYRGENEGMVGIISPDRDLRVDGMQASKKAIEEAEQERLEHERHGFVGGIKNFVKKHHHDHPDHQDHQDQSVHEEH
jgi:hypothetical protein